MAQTKVKSTKKFNVLCSDGEIRPVGEGNKLIVVPKVNMEQFPILRDSYRAWITSYDQHIVVKTTMPKKKDLPHGWHFVKQRWLGESLIFQKNIFGRQFGEANYRSNKPLNVNALKFIIAGIDNVTFYPSDEMIEKCQKEAIEICKAQLKLADDSSEWYYKTQLDRHQRYQDALEFEQKMLEKKAKERDEKTDIALSTLGETEEPKA